KNAGALRLAEEPDAVLVVGQQMGLQQLYCQRAGDLGVVGLVDAGHGALAHHLIDLIPPYFFHGFLLSRLIVSPCAAALLGRWRHVARKYARKQGLPPLRRGAALDRCRGKAEREDAAKRRVLSYTLTLCPLRR